MDGERLMRMCRIVLTGILALALFPRQAAWAEPAAAGDEGVLKEITKKSSLSAKKGLAWLLKAGNADGGYGLDVGQPSDIGCTAIVGLALMAQGNTTRDGPQSARVRKILKYILGRVRRMPRYNITTETGTQLQNKIGGQAHSFFATLFLSQIVGEEPPDSPSRQALTKLVRAVVSAQQADGSWGRQAWAPMLGTVMGWVSLRGTHSAGVPVRASAKRTAAYLLQQLEASRNSNQGWMHNLYKNATGIRVLGAIGRGNEKASQEAFEKVLSVINTNNTPFTQAGGEEYLSFHLITEVMRQNGGKHWRRWFPTVRDKIVGVQNSDGSWRGYHCITSRTFCTAAALLVLNAPFRYLPISDR
jgi:hypothetical protein